MTLASPAKLVFGCEAYTKRLAVVRLIVKSEEVIVDLIDPMPHAAVVACRHRKTLGISHIGGIENCDADTGGVHRDEFLANRDIARVRLWADDHGGFNLWCLARSNGVCSRKRKKCAE